MARLDEHRDEILELLSEGKSQSEIRRLFEERGIPIPRSTLSDFVRQQGEDDMTAATRLFETPRGQIMLRDPEQVSAAQLEATMRFQRDVADQVAESLSEAAEAIRTLRREMDSRHAAVLEAIGTIPAGTTGAEEITATLNTVLARTAVPALWGIWGKACVLTGIVWGTGVATWHYLPGFVSTFIDTLLH